VTKDECLDECALEQREIDELLEEISNRKTYQRGYLVRYAKTLPVQPGDTVRYEIKSVGVTVSARGLVRKIDLKIDHKGNIALDYGTVVDRIYEDGSMSMAIFTHLTLEMFTQKQEDVDND
jgi:hypothetical protein